MSNPKAEKEEIYEQFREKSHDKGKAYWGWSAKSFIIVKYPLSVQWTKVDNDILIG
jgi:hypothetical protein